MFTGIVQAVGNIAAAVPLETQALRMTIAAGGLDLSDVALGDSIAVNGVCLTVVAREDHTFDVDVSLETLRCVAGFSVGARANLEKALRLSDRLGGHLVAGHVDGKGTVVAVEDEAGSRKVTIELPEALARYTAAKGSITVDGVSLTINQVTGRCFSINLIPHTLDHTTLATLTPRTDVNIEVDLLARYLERLVHEAKSG